MSLVFVGLILPPEQLWHHHHIVFVCMMNQKQDPQGAPASQFQQTEEKINLLVEMASRL